MSDREGEGGCCGISIVMLEDNSFLDLYVDNLIMLVISSAYLLIGFYLLLLMSYCVSSFHRLQSEFVQTVNVATNRQRNYCNCHGNQDHALDVWYKKKPYCMAPGTDGALSRIALTLFNYVFH